MRFPLRGSLAAATLLGAASLTVPAWAEDGVTADTIVFGQAAVLEGPAADALVSHGTGHSVVTSLIWCAGITAVFAPWAIYAYRRP